MLSLSGTIFFLGSFYVRDTIQIDSMENVLRRMSHGNFFLKNSYTVSEIKLIHKGENHYTLYNMINLKSES